MSPEDEKEVRQESPAVAPDAVTGDTPGALSEATPPSVKNETSAPALPAPAKTAHWYRRLPRWVYKVAAVGVLGATISGEVNVSLVQSKVFTDMAEGKTFTEMQTSSPTVAPPAAGPYDERLGYTRTLQFRNRLTARGYMVVQENSWPSRSVAGLKLFPIYNEKAQAGLRITDGNGETLFNARFPRKIYSDYGSIPPVLVKSLLFVEDRQLLSDNADTYNNAVNWGRFTKAAFNQLRRKLHLGGDAAGGSTLATQTEKFRHSPGGVTSSGKEKLEQMLTASVRNYFGVANADEAAERIVTNYLNSIPLSSVPGSGEVIGFGDGVAAWFGADFDELNRLLKKPDAQMDEAELKQAADALRQSLRLVMSVTKPSAYLLRDREDLDQRVDNYLQPLTDAGIITPRMRDAVKAAKPAYYKGIRTVRTDGASRQKSIEALQINLMRDLGIRDIYALNRLDITGQTTVDARADKAVSELLHSLTDPEVAKMLGLTGFQLLNPELAAQLRYSFTLYEKLPNGVNVLRVQADNFDGAFNINEGSKLELGSTAKLRTLVSYLQAIAELHAKYSGVDTSTLARTQVLKEDNLSRWALDYLANPATDKSLEAMLEASLNRTYSGNPGERFFTGGGVHTFDNFDRVEDFRSYTVKDAFHHSVNLSFVRMMKDVVYYTQSQKMNVDASIFENPDDPMRKVYLERFIHSEGTTFLWDAWGAQKSLAPAETAAKLAAETRRAPSHLAIVYRTVFPDDTVEKMEEFIRKECANCGDATNFQKLYDDYAPGKFDLNDMGYITGIHPLALWLADFRAKAPDAGWDAAVAASKDARLLSYKWLMKPDKLDAQNTRIRIEMEKEAFTHIHATWKALGYSFDKMVSSYASALGSSGDTPAALATLSGILQNGGVLTPAIRFTEIEFASGTPYALDFKPQAQAGKRVLPEEVARLARREMNGVVENGTARRANKAVVLSDGRVLDIGGKTGTGDNREQSFGSNGGVLASEAKSRTATFVFAIGDRFYGTVTAFVDGPDAGKHHFTSALATSVLKVAVNVPEMRPVFDKAYGVDPAKTAAPVTPQKAAPVKTKQPAPKAAGV